MKSLLPAAALALSALACAGAPVAPPAPSRTAADYSPLKKGAAWLYEVDYPGQKGEMLVRMTGEVEGYAVDDRGGSFRHSVDGLRDRDRFLIKQPLEPGASWKSVVGPSAVEHMTIESVGAPCESPAGSFPDCVVVVGKLRRDKTMSLSITWTWARDVGLVRLETAAEFEGKGTVPQVSQRLKWYSLDGAPPPASTLPPPPGARPPPPTPAAPAPTAPAAGGDDGPDTWTSE